MLPGPAGCRSSWIQCAPLRSGWWDGLGRQLVRAGYLRPIDLGLCLWSISESEASAHLGVCSSRSSLLAGFMRPDGPGRGAGTMSHTDERSFSSPGPLRFTPLSHWIPLKQAGSRRAWAGPPKAMATVAGPNPHFCNPPHPSSSLARIVCSYHRRQQFTWPSYAYFAIRRV